MFKNVLLILKNIALFIAAPFIALAYIFVLPGVCIYMTIRMIIEVLENKRVEATNTINETVII